MCILAAATPSPPSQSRGLQGVALLLLLLLLPQLPARRSSQVPRGGAGQAEEAPLLLGQPRPGGDVTPSPARLPSLRRPAQAFPGRLRACRALLTDSCCPALRGPAWPRLRRLSSRRPFP